MNNSFDWIYDSFAWLNDAGIKLTPELLNEPFLLHLLEAGCQTREELTSLLREEMKDPGTAMWRLFGHALEVSGQGREPLDTAPCDEELLAILRDHMGAIVGGVHQLTVVILGKQLRALDPREEQALVAHAVIHASSSLIAHLRDTVPAHARGSFIEAVRTALNNYQEACIAAPSNN